MASLTVRLQPGQKPVVKTISLNPDDPCYRYKAKQLLTQIQGKGKMIKTLFLNLDEVTQSLSTQLTATHQGVDPHVMVAFMGYQLGAKWYYKKSGMSYISGDIPPNIMEGLMHQYLDDFLICPQCTIPELHLRTGEEIVTECSSCGWKGKPHMDPKLENFLAKKHDH